MTKNEQRLMKEFGLDDVADLSQEFLDEKVHDFKGGEASDINNSGREEQMAYLLERLRF